MTRWGMPKRSPVIEFANGKRLINPTLQELAGPPASGAIVRRSLSTSRSSARDRPELPRLCMRLRRAFRRSCWIGSVPVARRPRRPESRTSSVFPTACLEPTSPRAAFCRCSSSARRWWRPSLSNHIDPATGPDDFHTLASRLRYPTPRPHHSRGNGCALATTRRRRRGTV